METVEEKFRTIRNVPYAFWALEWKHIAIKKMKKSGSEFDSYKGFFSLVLLALVNAEYRFLWVHTGLSGSSSDAQVFNHCELKKEKKNGTFGLRNLNP